MYKSLCYILNQTLTETGMNYFKESINEGSTKFFTCAATAVLSALSTFIAPIQTVVIAVCALILIDALLGIRVAYVQHEKIESHKMWKTIKKFCWAFLSIACAHIVDSYIIVSVDLHLIEMFAGIIAGVELWSIIENLQTLDPTGPWRIFGKVIQTKGEKYLNIQIDKEDLPKVKKLVKKIK